ncbi:hypothetical protein, partial [Acidithiobacillus thiooxidans]
MIRITNRHVLLSVTLAFSCVLLPQIALAYVQAPSNTRNINGPIHVNAGDKDWVTHVLPTGRIVSPVGTVNGAPN